MIVSGNAETLDGLHGYLANAGVSAHCVMFAQGGGSKVDVLDMPDRVSAVVIFPDDFAREAVVPLFARLRRRRPKVFVLLVTRRPQQLESLLRSKDRSPALMILPRPSFGWDILDAIRAHAQIERPLP